MLPDLRILIPATVATFFLAAAAGLFASTRIAHDPLGAFADSRAAVDEQSPIMRISASWPLPEQSRSAALRDLAIAVKHSTYAVPDPATVPAVPSEPDIRREDSSSGELQHEDNNGKPQGPISQDAASSASKTPDNIESPSAATGLSTPDIAPQDSAAKQNEETKKKTAQPAPRKKRRAVTTAAESSGSISSDTYVPNSTVPIAN